ncbi:MAG TPA: hypothetical protein VJC21_05125, partial [Candidatus Nanoarchaeia archaeon]|nr:hypothetical protein [Candidatus Nanoarchaeia archaeon]
LASKLCRAKRAQRFAKGQYDSLPNLFGILQLVVGLYAPLDRILIKLFACQKGYRTTPPGPASPIH